MGTRKRNRGGNAHQSAVEKAASRTPQPPLPPIHAIAETKSRMRFAPPVLAVVVGVGLFAAMFAFEFFGTYLSSVLIHWVALMSGGVSVVIGFYQQIRKKAGPYVLYVVAAMCVFFAGFQAWQDQHRALVSEGDNLHRTEKQLADLTIPRLTGRIDSVASAPTGKDKGLFTILATIHNQGAPTVLDGWYAILKLSNGRTLTGYGLPPPLPGQYSTLYFGRNDATSRMLSEVDHLVAQTKSHPIVQGGGISGWVMFLFPVSMKEAHDAILTLSFKDIAGKPYSFDMKIKNTDSLPVSLEELQQSNKKSATRR